MMIPTFSSIVYFVLLFGPLLHVLGSEEILQKILNDTFYDYDKNIRPSYGVRPVEVKVAIHIVSISRVDTANQEYTIDFYLKTIWSDQRLSFAKPRVSNITLEAEYIRRMWSPDVNFITDRTNNVINEQLTLRQNGEVEKCIRVTVTASCPMDLKNWPFDHPVCPLIVESFTGSVQDIKYEWLRSPPLGPITIADDAATGDFSIARFRLQSKDTPAISPGIGLHSRLTLEIQLKRILGRYEYDFSILTWIVILSIATLWIGNTKLSISLSIVNLLALLLLNKFQVSELNFPKWAKSNWLDCYVRLSSTFIFFVILANLLELNMPEQSEQTEEAESENVRDEKEDDEIELKDDEENRIEKPPASVSGEDDTKLCITCESPPKNELLPADQVIALKLKFHSVQQQFFDYVQIALPYVRWGLLITFLLVHLIFWKSTPNFKPLADL